MAPNANGTLSLPPPSADQAYVTISALEGGHLTLPERLFITDADPEKRTTVPSLSFLIHHPSKDASQPPTRIVFDLGLKRNLSRYPPAMQSHISQRQPVITSPDVAESLRAGGLDPARDIDYVILSHVHWDHVGTPDDFPHSTFIVGPGTLHLLEHGAPPYYPAEIFDKDLLPRDRTCELPPVSSPQTTRTAGALRIPPWQPLGDVFPHAVDLFSDGSIYLIDSPGHLYGHLNLLARVGPNRWVYLGGDCCHDVRILTGEKGIGMYDDGSGTGRLRSVHVDTDRARETLKKIGKLLRKGQGQDVEGEDQVEVIVAHDVAWREANRGRFWPGKL